MSASSSSSTPTVLITGASRGIGEAAARAFAAAGYQLLLVARSADALEALAAELRSPSCRVETAAVDLAEPLGIAAALEELLNRGLQPTVLINNAGAAYTGSLASMSLERWQWLLQLNVTSVFQVCQAVLPALRSQGGGHIINVSSHAARNAFPDWAPIAPARRPWPPSAAAWRKRSAATGSGCPPSPWVR